MPDDKCSGHGTCNKKRGQCQCQYEWSGESCQYRKCPGPNGVLYPMESGNACTGNGACIKTTGKCQCPAKYSGPACQFQECKVDCFSGNRGGCNRLTGRCSCKDGYVGSNCQYKPCPMSCRGAENGWCEAISGKCLCKYGFSGKSCRSAGRCPPDEKEHQVNWWTIWDKPGWALCPKGQAAYAFLKSKCSTLSCLNGAKCAGLCLEGKKPLKERHCYHTLSWYTAFDTAGWASCESGYYISGLYRSSDSLYGLNMAKCCSFHGARWVQCETVSWASQVKSEGYFGVEGGKKFLTGLHRKDGHTLENLDRGKACGYAVGF
jgi:hypothetical protein